MQTAHWTTKHYSLIEKRLKELIPEKHPLFASLFEASHYILFAPKTKRVRPLLLFNLLEDLGICIQVALDPVCAIEMIHTYSLIHDDLPCMDDDDMRRGQPSLHQAYNEAHAILTGDYLLTAAFRVIAKSPHLTSNQKVSLIEVLSSAGEEMVGGQVMDLACEGTQIDAEILRTMFEKKTGALFSASLECGGILSNVNEKDRLLLRKTGKVLGIGFQMLNDLSHNPLNNSDLKKQKATALTLYTKEEAQEKAQGFFNQACTLLSHLTCSSSHLVSFLLSLEAHFS